MDAGQYMEAECKEAGRGEAGGYLVKNVLPYEHANN
jgi:hypothetical protein